MELKKLQLLVKLLNSSRFNINAITLFNEVINVKIKEEISYTTMTRLFNEGKIPIDHQRSGYDYMFYADLIKEHYENVLRYDFEWNEKTESWDFYKKEDDSLDFSLIQQLENNDYETILQKVKKDDELILVDAWPAYLVDSELELKSWAARPKKISILILDPNSELFFKRLEAVSATKIEPDVNIKKKNIIRILEAITERDDYGSKIEIRFSEEPLGMNIFMTKSWCYAAPFASYDLTKNTIWFKSLGGAFKTQTEKHFITLWNRSRRLLAKDDIKSDPVNDILISEIYKPEEYRKLLGQKFVLYNLDRNEQTPYQSSLIYIADDGWKCTLTYLSRESDKEENIEGIILEINAKSISMTFKRADFYLDILIYLPLPDFNTNESFVKCIYSHSDKGEAPNFSFAILMKVDMGKSPSRNKEDVPEMIISILDYYANNKTNFDTSATTITELWRKTTAQKFPYFKRNKKETLKRELLNKRDSIFFYGNFYQYAYGLYKTDDFDAKCIHLCKISITEYGFVEFLGTDNQTAYGYAKLIGENMYIHLFIDDLERDGLLVINVGQEEDFSESSNNIACGIFTGLSKSRNLPISKRLILVKETIASNFDKQKTNKILLNSEEYFKLNEYIRRTLTGRRNNYIGFNKSEKGIRNIEELRGYWENSFKYDEIFYIIALLSLKCANKESQISGIVDMLKRAVMHGRLILVEFEKLLEQHSLRDLIEQNKDYIKLKNFISASFSNHKIKPNNEYPELLNYIKKIDDLEKLQHHLLAINSILGKNNL